MDQLKSIFFDCGQGDMTLLIFPTGKTMLIDVCLNGEDDSNIEKIKMHLQKDKNNNPILDYLVITHPHNDHIKNIKMIPNSGIKIQNIWESGHRLYISEEDRKDNNYKDYDDMLAMINNLKNRDSSKYKDLEADTNPITNKYEFGDDVKIYVFAPSGNIANEKRTREEQEKLIHRHCAVLKVQFKNNAILFTGDSSYEEWRDSIIVNYPNLVQSTILHVSHHGSLTFFTENGELPENDFDFAHLLKIFASGLVVSVGKNSFGHPNYQAMQIYEQFMYCPSCIYTTKEQGTMIAILNSNNTWQICPEKFKRETTTSEFKIKIKSITPSPSPAIYQKGQDLKFSIEVTKNLSAIKKIIWQVQNNGIGDEKDSDGIMDKYHHELFYGVSTIDDTEISSKTAYNGTHLLRCTAYDENGLYSTDVIDVTISDYDN